MISIAWATATMVFFLPLACDHPTVERAKVRVLRPRRCPGRLDQPTPQPNASLPSFSATTLTRALVVAWTEAGPTGEVMSVRELIHIGTDFGNQVRSSMPGIVFQRSTAVCSEPFDSWFPTWFSQP